MRSGSARLGSPEQVGGWRFFVVSGWISAIAMGDFAVIDYTSTVEGKPTEEFLGKAAGYLSGREGFWVRLDEKAFLPGFTAQLGAMRISEEIDALEVMAIPSLRYLVTTRMIAALIAVVPLYLVGLFASYMATALAVIRVKGQSEGTYGYYFSLFLSPNDIWLSLIKVMVFAVVVTLVHCYYGYTATGGPEGVGRAAGRALRTSIVFLAFTDVAMTIALWGLKPHVPGLTG